MVSKAKNEIIDGEVLEAFPNTMFKVKLNNDRVILATLKGSMRKRYVRVFPGDRVSVELTGFDEDRGRIVYKF
jgi:translation initiation factor IF-1